MWCPQIGFVYLRVKEIKVMNKQMISYKDHALEMLEARFNVNEIDITRMKCVTQQNAFKYPVLAQKYRSGIHMSTRYLVDTSRNLALAVVDNLVITVLYLDGRYGY